MAGMTTNMIPLIEINTYGRNATMVSTINEISETGFNAVMINQPKIMDHPQQDLNVRERTTRQSNSNVIYIGLTSEMLNSIRQDRNLVESLSGDLNMPRFDKLIMATTASQAVLTTLYHLSEGHLITNNVARIYILEQVMDVNAQHLRQGSQMINTFNRGFSTPQLQISTGSSIAFNQWELDRQIIWELQPLQLGNIFDMVFNKFTWNNGYMWSFNTLINLNNLEDYLVNNEVTIIQAFEYTGTHVLQHLPAPALNKVMDFLNSLDTLRFTTKRGLNLNRVKFWGVKDSTRLRGSSTHAKYLSDYMRDPTSFNEYAKEVNTWRQSFNNGEEDINMENEDS